MRIKSLIIKYKEIILYIVFGVFTTLVNYAVYFSCKYFGIGYELSTVISWIAAVTFAFITNKIWVFESKTSGFLPVLKETGMFFSARVFSLLLELLIMKIGMDFLHAGAVAVVLLQRNLPIGEFITKTIAQAVVLITNFILSKLIVFRKKSEDKKDENIIN